MNNYFRTSDGRVFPFADGTLGTDSAFLAAKATGLPVCIFKVAKNPGPWDRVAIIGYRTTGEILRDLARARSAKSKLELQAELSILTALYVAAGRRCLPPQAVAA